MQTVYLNGEFVPADAAMISPFDRGFLFAQAGYEVTAVYQGQLIDFGAHMQRLERTLAGLRIPNPKSTEAWRDLHKALIERNAMSEGLIYLHVTAGAYGHRDYAGPADLTPGIFMFATAKPLIDAVARDGIKAILQPDTRWARRDLKTTQLVSQALAYRAAQEQGATTAILHQDGYVTEAASANVWIVDARGNLLTRDLSHDILPGITRSAVKAQLAGAGRAVIETRFSVDTLRTAREVFTTSAGALIAPIIAIDGEPVGAGTPGPVTRQVQALYYQAMGADLGVAAPWL